MEQGSSSHARHLGWMRCLVQTLHDGCRSCRSVTDVPPSYDKHLATAACLHSMRQPFRRHGGLRSTTVVMHGRMETIPKPLQQTLVPFR